MGAHWFRENAVLAPLGWTETWATAFAPHAADGLVPGRVSLEHNHVYRVLTAAGERLTEASGRLKHRAAGRSELPAVGDWVALREGAAGHRWQIRVVLPRRTRVSRRVAGRTTDEQVLAANVDTLFIVAGLDLPVNANRLERYLALARQSGIRPVIVLNKADLCADPAAAVAEACAVAGDAEVVLASVRTGAGVDRLRSAAAPGQTVALLGPSGVGKSSIINVLVGHALLATAEVREQDAKGRHTSVHRQLVPLEGGGVLIDTPGMRELQLWDSDEGVLETFGDIEALAPGCRFRDCRHDREPGCAVKAAVEAGTLDAGHYENFLKLSHEREGLARQQDARALLDEKRQSKIANRALKSMQKERGR